MKKESRRSPSAAAAAVTLVCLLLPAFYAACIHHNISPLRLTSWEKGVSGTGSLGKAGRISETGEPLSFLLRRLVRGKDRRQLDANGVSCVSDDPISDICVVNQPVAMDTRRTTLHFGRPPNFQHPLRPYARKPDGKAMQAVKSVLLLGPTAARDRPPSCDVSHSVPAVVFSSGGFSTNLFHDFNDILLPLFLTTFHFRAELRLVVVDLKPEWVHKFRPLLSSLSRYEVIDPVADGRVHCFPGAVVGLRYHSDLFCNATEIPGGYSNTDFKRFLRHAFSLPPAAPHSPKTNPSDRAPPLMVILSRRFSRMILNEDKMAQAAKALGFRVTVASPQRAANLEHFAQVVHRCDVLVGTHGAGLTNLVFLPERAVLIQVVPLGLDWASETYYGKPAREMGVHYLEYKVEPEESTLLDKYPRDHPVIVDPASVHRQGYNVSRAVYVDGQNVRLDLSRFNGTLMQAVELLRGSDINPIN